MGVRSRAKGGGLHTGNAPLLLSGTLFAAARPAAMLLALSLAVLMRPAAQADDTPPVLPTPQYSQLQPGLALAQLRVPSVPWRIHVVRLDRQATGLRLRTTLGGGASLGLTTVPAQARASATTEWTPWAAVNGGYFREQRGLERATLAGLMILEGELVSRPANTSFWVDATNGLHIAVIHSRLELTWPEGTTSPLGLNELPATNRPALITARYGAATRVTEGAVRELRGVAGKPWPTLRPSDNFTVLAGPLRPSGRIALPGEGALLLAHPAQSARLDALAEGASLRISTALSEDLSGARWALGAGPTLLTRGVPNATLHRPDADTSRHPRTAIGFNERHFFMVAVDGRALRSAGMSFPELTALLTHLGCVDAMNLDGGSSTSLWVRDRLVNSPAGWLTPAVANALVIQMRAE